MFVWCLYSCDHPWSVCGVVSVPFVGAVGVENVMPTIVCV